MRRELVLARARRARAADSVGRGRCARPSADPRHLQAGAARGAATHGAAQQVPGRHRTLRDDLEGGSRGARRSRANRACAPLDAWPIAPLGVHCVVFEVTGTRAVATYSAHSKRIRGWNPRNRCRPSTYSRATCRRTGGRRETGVTEGGGANDGVALSGRGYDDPYLELQHSARELQLQAAQRFASGRGIDIA